MTELAGTELREARVAHAVQAFLQVRSDWSGYTGVAQGFAAQAQ